MRIIPEQLKLDTPLLPIIGNIDYDQYQAELDLMDKLCRQSGVDDERSPRGLSQTNSRHAVAISLWKTGPKERSQRSGF